MSAIAAGLLAGASPTGVLCQSGRDCLSGYCTDHICCDAECSGTCASCRQPGQAGTCVLMTGAPDSQRGSCLGFGPCAGSCDGVRAFCSYPATETLCGGGTCIDAIASDPMACDGRGQCRAGPRHDCPTGCDGVRCAWAALRSDDSGCASGGAGLASLSAVALAVALRRRRRAGRNRLD